MTSLRQWRRSCDLVFACVLFSVSTFSLYLTVRNFQRVLEDRLRLYSFFVQLCCCSVSLVSSVLCVVASMFRLHRYTILATLLCTIMSIFGSLMTGAITVFNINWLDHYHALEQVIRLCLSAVVFIASTYLAIVLTKKFRASDRPPNQENGRNKQLSVTITVPILASLMIISGGTAILGFAMGAATLRSRVGEILYGGGIHAGFLAVIVGILSVASLYFFRDSSRGVLISTITLCLLTLVSSSIAFYTEEIELQRHMKRYPETTPTTAVHHILLAKCTLVLFAALFNLIFGLPLLACLCCSLQKAFEDRTAYAATEYSCNDCNSVGTGPVFGGGGSGAGGSSIVRSIRHTPDYAEHQNKRYHQMNQMNNHGMYSMGPI